MTLAESAVHVPFASLGAAVAYSTVFERAAVLLEHLVKNHPLPDGNKRAAFLLTARHLDASGLTWGPADVDEDAAVVERIAAGEADHHELVDWIHRRATVE